MTGIETILIATAISLAASAAASAIASSSAGRTQTGRQNDFTEPRSSFGDVIGDVWGVGRVSGILIWASFPPEERVSSSGGKGPRGTDNYSYWGNCAFMLASETTAIEELRLNSRVVYQNGAINELLVAAGTQIRIYTGSADQGVDPLLQVYLGDRALNYRGRTIVVIENLPLEEFGNSYPQCSGRIRKGNPKLSTVIREICLESPRFTVDDIDVSELISIDVTGFQVDRESSFAEKLRQLQQIHFFDLIDTGDRLRFQRQFRPAAVAYIPPSQLAAHEEGQERPRNYRENITDPTELPTQYEVRFRDINNNLQPGLARSEIFPLVDNVRVETIDYSGALTENEARTIANRALWLAHTRAYTQEFSLPPKYANLEPGDVIEIDIDGRRRQLQISSIEYGSNHQLNVRSWAYNAAIYGWIETADATYTATATATQGDPIPLPTTPSTNIVVSDGVTTYTAGTDYTVAGSIITPIVGGGIPNGTNLQISYEAPREPIVTPLPIVSDTDLRVLDIPRAYENDFPLTASGTSGGLYVFGDGDANWRNASLFLSRDGGVTYDRAGALIQRSIFGTCETTFDGVSVDVRLPFHAELASISTELFNLGENRALIGDEMLDFQNAELLGEDGGDRIYRITGPFNRGLSGSPTAHGANEDFYLLSEYNLKLAGTPSDIGQTLYFKALSPGQQIADVDPVIVAVVGRSTISASESFALDYEKIRAFL